MGTATRTTWKVEVLDRVIEERKQALRRARMVYEEWDAQVAFLTEELRKANEIRATLTAT